MRTVRVGYIPGPAPATHLWLGLEKGYFEQEGLKVEATRFNTGISLSNALTGGSLDLGVMGPVIANFPSRGQGKVFLLNSIEKNIHQLWVDPASGINTVADLAGKTVATTSGTAAHMFLLVALREAGVDPASVQIVNSDIAAATNAFISGAVPAVALWAPFDAQVKEQRPEAKMIDSAINYYPDKLAIVGGWVANSDFFDKNPDVLEAVTRAWMKANADIVADPAGSVEIAHRQATDLMSLEQYETIFEAAGWLSNEEWSKNFSDGTAQKWVGDLERLFVDMGALKDYVEPSTFFDTSIYTRVYENANK
jgi:NitT/TauT family transport system substrate-binding protein